MPSMRLAAGLIAVALIVTASVDSAHGIRSSADIDRDVDAALARLYATVPNTRQLANRARGILVFPSIVKAGFLFGAQYGEGALRQRGATAGYYNSIAASYGLQAGIQSFGYALFFMSDSGLRHLEKTGGFGEGMWTKRGKAWHIQMRDTLPSGERASSVNIMTVIDKNRITWESVDRQAGGVLLPSVGPVNGCWPDS